MTQFSAWLTTLGGLIVFAAAYYIHQKVRLTRFACVLAVVAGFMTYAAVIGTWVNRIAAEVSILAAAGVLIGIAIIVADVKGKKKGADRPALFAFFLVPIFLVAGLTALPKVIDQAGNGLEKAGDSVSSQMER